MRRLPICLAAVCLAFSAIAAEPFDDKFRQLEELLPTPNTIRTASGAPGHAYWQQRADYVIRATLDEPNRAIHAAETVTYHNNSPDTLSYLWLQLDQNLFTPGSDNHSTATVLSREAWSKGRSDDDGLRFDTLRSTLESRSFQGGFNIESVKDADGQALKFVINKTMMRIDLAQGLKPGATLSFSVAWHYNINDAKALGGRSGYERFDDADKNDVFEIAQWFPRMAAYYDVVGW